MDDSDTQDMEADYSSIRREENRRYLNAFISLLIHFYFSARYAIYEDEQEEKRLKKLRKKHR